MIEERIEEALRQLDALRAEALEAIRAAESTAELERLRVEYTGRKSTVNRVLQVMPKLGAEDKKRLGAAVNVTRQEIEAVLTERTDDARRLEMAQRLEAERLDVTLPGTPYGRGYTHPVLQAMREILGVFEQLGYTVYEGPEVEWDRYNFELLNIPKNHPARDLQDTFYVSDEIVLRTQTSPGQIRIMESHQPPIRMVVPGIVYRNEAEDATHLDQFFQIEGLTIDTDITMGDLKGTLAEVAHRFFGPDRRVRFRPSYFPFTEPSAEMDVECGICKGTGCRSCGNEGWLELLGSGMVHPKVLENVGYDPEKVSGFAFGMGPERFTMMNYDVPDLRLFLEGDLRFLRQFS